MKTIIIVDERARPAKMMSKMQQQWLLWSLYVRTAILAHFSRIGLFPFVSHWQKTLIPWCRQASQLRVAALRYARFYQVGTLPLSLVAAISIAIVLAVSFSTPSIPFASTAVSSDVYQVVRVQNGDSIWSIASRHATNKQDIRRLIFAIKSINGLSDDSLIYPGQTIKVPATTDR